MSRKAFLILALAAPAAGAFAQSQVSIYGIVDLSVGVERAGSGAGSTKTLQSGVGYGSRLGFKGQEDLGGGLAANFVLESGIAADTGALQQGGLLFGRQAFVGLSTPRWSLAAGRQYSPLWQSVTLSDAFGQTYWGNAQATTLASASPASVAGDGGHGALSRINNSISASATQGAWTERLMLAAGDENTSGSGRLSNASLTYSAGPLALTASLARLRQYAKDLPAGASPDWQNAYEVGGQYDFGLAKLFGAYYTFDPSERNVALKATTATRTRALWIGAQIPVGSGRVITQLTSTRFDRPTGVAQGRGTTWGVTYEHALSKRSFLYTSYGQVTNNATSSLSLYGGTTSVAPKSAGDDPKALSVGMRHAF